jgi:RNA polymerase sigma-70 factor, ECF subfamily
MDDDADLMQRLRAGDEQAFVMLVRRYHDPMLRLACSFVPSIAVARRKSQHTGHLPLVDLAAMPTSRTSTMN